MPHFIYIEKNRGRLKCTPVFLPHETFKNPNSAGENLLYRATLSYSMVNLEWHIFDISCICWWGGGIHTIQKQCCWINLFHYAHDECFVKTNISFCQCSWWSWLTTEEELVFGLPRKLGGGGVSGPLEDLERERLCFFDVRESFGSPRDFRGIENWPGQVLSEKGSRVLA